MPVPTIPYEFYVDWQHVIIDEDVMGYKIIKLEQPIYRPGKRVFRYKIVRDDKSTVFLFQDLKIAEDTLVKLGS